MYGLLLSSLAAFPEEVAGKSIFTIQCGNSGSGRGKDGRIGPTAAIVGTDMSKTNWTLWSFAVGPRSKLYFGTLLLLLHTQAGVPGAGEGP